MSIHHAHHMRHNTNSAARHSRGAAWITSAQATLHCLIGCVIGEVAGLMIGVSLGFPVWATITLAVVLAYISGFALGVLPVMKREGMSFTQAFRVIWLGEAISIGVMEFVMNGVDYHMGGMTAGSVFHPAFWVGLAYAIPAGFLVTWPVNHILLKRQMKKCH